VFPKQEATSFVFVNDTLDLYASNYLNYGFMSDAYTGSQYEDRSDQVWSLPVVCEYPISSTYGRLHRILYYLALVFALVVQSHEWLVAGVLALATLYSGAAAIQGWVQLGVVTQSSNHGAGDNDNEAIIAILAAGLLMAVPLMNWNRTLRKLRVQPILIFWVVIVFLGCLLVLAGTAQTNNARGWRNNAGGIMT